MYSFVLTFWSINCR